MSNKIEKEPLLQDDSAQISLKQHLKQALQNAPSQSTTSNTNEDEKTPSILIDNTKNNNNNTQETKTDESKEGEINNYEEITTYRDFYTEYGTQRVTISGDLNSGKPVIMTYHDIGVNHVACYQSLFSIINSYPNILRYFVIVHIDAPGHHYSDDNNEQDSINKDSTKNNVDTTNINAFDLNKLASFIENIEYELKINRFFGMGIGAGCNVWLEYAKQNNNNKDCGLRGLILINPTNFDASWREWAVDNMFHYIGHSNQWLRDVVSGSMIPRYNGWEPLTEESGAFLLSEINKIDEQSAIKYFRGYTKRKALTRKELKKLKFRFLILVSEESKVMHSCLQFQNDLPNDKVDFVKFDHGSYLMTESHPQQLIKPIEMFVESLGVSQLTMEMKFGKIEE